jgi:hypothetical protein
LPSDVAPGLFNFHHIRAEIREQPGRVRARDVLREVEDSHVIQRLHVRLHNWFSCRTEL